MINRHRTPKGVRNSLQGAGYKHDTPPGCPECHLEASKELQIENLNPLRLHDTIIQLLH